MCGFRVVCVHVGRGVELLLEFWVSSFSDPDPKFQIVLFLTKKRKKKHDAYVGYTSPSLLLGIF